MGAFTKLFGNAILENVLVGTTTSTAKLQVKGGGSTSATNSFLLQNSSGTQLGYIDDSGQWMIGTGTNGGYSLDINGSLRSGVINLRVNSGLIRYDTNNYIQLPNQGGPVSGIFADAGYGWLYSNGSQVYSQLFPGNGTTIASSWRISQSTSNIGKNDIFITTDLTNAIGSQSTGEAISMLNVNNFAASPQYAYRPSLKIRAGNSGEQNGADKYQPAGHLYLEAGDANSGTATNIAGGNMYLNAGKGTGTGTPGDIIFSTSTTTISGTTLQTLSNCLWVKGTTGNVGIGESSPTARLQVKGSGSTSATTSLLVQNSGGNSALSITDDLRANFGGSIRLTSGNIYVNLNSPSSDAFYSGVNGTINFIASAGGRLKSNRILAEDVNGVGTLSNSAIMQINSTTLGFLPPRMTSAQKIAIVSPAEGLMVYDTDLKRPCFHDGTNWITL